MRCPLPPSRCIIHVLISLPVPWGWGGMVMERTGLLSHRSSSWPDLPNPPSPLCVHPSPPVTLQPLLPRSHGDELDEHREPKLPVASDFREIWVVLPGRSPGERRSPFLTLPLLLAEMVAQSRERLNRCNVSFFTPFFSLFSVSPSDTHLLAWIENATIVNFLLCRGAIDGA